MCYTVVYTRECYSLPKRLLPTLKAVYSSMPRVKHFFSSSISYVNEHRIYAGIALVVILALLWFFFVRNGGGDIETLTVVRGDFLQQVSVSGNVAAADDVDLGFSQAGRGAGVYVTVGQRVARGAVLSEIENGDLRAAVLQKEAALEIERADLASLKAGTREEEIAVSQSTVTRDEVALAQAHTALYNAMVSAYTTSDSAVHNTLDQFISNSRIDPELNFSTSNFQAENDFETKRAEAETVLAKWKQSISERQPESDLSALVSASKEHLLFISSLLSDASVVLSVAIPNTSVSESDLSGYRTDIGTARKDINTTTTSLTTAVTSQKAAITTLETSRRNLELDEAGSTKEDIAAGEAQVRAAEANVVSARADLSKTLIVAPFAGTAARVDAKVGKIVSPNTPEISLISMGVFQIESFIAEVNIANINVGDTAVVTLDAYGPDAPFTAVVVSIDPAETLREGVSTYKTTLQFSQTDPRIKSGMTADILITTGEKPNTIIIPQGALLKRGSGTFVQVLLDDKVSERPVKTGLSSLGQIEIVSGLEEGERVVYNPTR